MAVPNVGPSPASDSQHLHAIVDMGSNGIRFSITSLARSHARILPTVYQHRAGISLYDAQYPSSSPTAGSATAAAEKSSASGQRQPIDENTISAVTSSLKRFQRVCNDFRVPASQIRVLATEATRTAPNSEVFRGRIKEATGWEVEMLPKEEEGRIGAFGVVSSLPEVRGLVMDLGGGSTQLGVLNPRHDGQVDPVSISLPYGAAALMRRLGEADKNADMEELRQVVMRDLRKAFEDLKIPQELLKDSKDKGGFTLYLSGGGFRGWGYVLMSRHQVHPYPIPVINGFRALRQDFLGTEDVKTAASAALKSENEEIFRVSDRRASQVPAVALLINCLAQAIPEIREVRFCQGGVREGYLYKSLPAEIKSQNPLVVATQAFKPPSAEALGDLIASAIPAKSTVQETFTPLLLQAFTNLMYYHSTHSKDLQPSAALRSTTSGILAGVHGLVHESRALLALLLCARWGGDVPPTDQDFKLRLERVVEAPWTIWWIQYFGAVASLIAAIYPAGLVDGERRRMQLSSAWGYGGKGQSVLELRIDLHDDEDRLSLEKEIPRIEKVGKKKNWIGGHDGVGCKIKVEVGTLGAR